MIDIALDDKCKKEATGYSTACISTGHVQLLFISHANLVMLECQTLPSNSCSSTHNPVCFTHPKDVEIQNHMML